MAEPVRRSSGAQVLLGGGDLALRTAADRFASWSMQALFSCSARCRHSSGGSVQSGSNSSSAESGP
jgi:hypothetical protein